MSTESMNVTVRGCSACGGQHELLAMRLAEPIPLEQADSLYTHVTRCPMKGRWVYVRAENNVDG